MSQPSVSFAKRLAAVADGRKSVPPSAAVASPVTRKTALLRLIAIGLVVCGLGIGLHTGTAARRAQERSERIERAIVTSGVDSGVVGTGAAHGGEVAGTKESTK